MNTMEGGGKLVNKKLKAFRILNNGVSQQEMAEKMSVSPATYRQVEAGIRKGSATFWDKFQETFDIADEEMRAFEKGRE